MAGELDPDWEYWMPDPEIAELMNCSPSRSSLYDMFDLTRESRTSNAWGVSIRSISQLRLCGHLAPRRPDSSSRSLPRKSCARCGSLFQPSRSTRERCFFCRYGADRTLQDRQCIGCGETFRPVCSSQIYHSLECANSNRVSACKGVFSVIDDEVRDLKTHGMTHIQLAERLGVSVPTVKRSLRRTRVEQLP